MSVVATAFFVTLLAQQASAQPLGDPAQDQLAIMRSAARFDEPLKVAMDGHFQRTRGNARWPKPATIDLRATEAALHAGGVMVLLEGEVTGPGGLRLPLVTQLPTSAGSTTRALSVDATSHIRVSEAPGGIDFALGVYVGGASRIGSARGVRDGSTIIIALGEGYGARLRFNLRRPTAQEQVTLTALAKITSDVRERNEAVAGAGIGSGASPVVIQSPLTNSLIREDARRLAP